MNRIKQFFTAKYDLSEVILIASLSAIITACVMEKRHHDYVEKTRQAIDKLVDKFSK